MDESFEESFATSDEEIQEKIVKQKRLRKTKTSPAKETKRKKGMIQINLIYKSIV